MKKKYFSLEKNNDEATINIFGDINSGFDWWGTGSGVTAKTLSRTLEEMKDVSRINVYINSYGGEVAEGLAIYNALKRHKAKVVTYCDGFAASIASVIFMAGSERIMNDSSLLMIHNAWTYAEGNAEQLRKAADDVEKINEAAVTAYKTHSSLSVEEIKDLMNKETWILPAEALKYGFATSIEESGETEVSQSVKKDLFALIKAHRQEAAADEGEGEDPKPNEGEGEDPKPDEGEGEDPKPDEGEGEDPKPNEGEGEDPKPNEDEDEAENALDINAFFNAIFKK